MPQPRPHDYVDPGDYVTVLGQSFVTHERRALLTIGTRKWGRHALGLLGCPHPTAAATLDRVIKELGITSIAQLAAQIQQVGSYKGVGVTAYWTVLAILREAGYRVEQVHAESVTYDTMKRRARKIEARETRAKRARKRRAGPPSQAE